MARLNCVHGNQVNQTCVCDLLWTGDLCQQRDCQAGVARDSICHCHLRHAGEFCEYQACYHKDVLYCWGLKDVQFLPCNSSAVGGVDPETVRNPVWYCPCGQGRRTPPPYSHCVCSRGYGGEFCNNRLCDGDDCDDPTVLANGQTPYFNNDGNAPGIVVPDSVKVALVCMSMVVLVALVIWLKRVCFRHRSSDRGDTTSESVAANLRAHYDQGHPMTPAQLNATLLMLQSRHNYAYGWEGGPPTNGTRRGSRVVDRPAPLPSYDEANSAPPSYASILAQRQVSSVSFSVLSRKQSNVGDAEAGCAEVHNASQERAPVHSPREGTPPTQNDIEECQQQVKSKAINSVRRRSL